MNWVFPIAGFGTRTSSLGKYKPLIDVFSNHSVLKMCLCGIGGVLNSDDRLIFIASKQQEEDFDVSRNIRKILMEIGLSNEMRMITLDITPNGQALTLKEGIKTLTSDILEEKVFVVNSDQMVFFDPRSVNTDKCSVGIYFNDEPSSCFYELDINSKIVKGIREKEMISGYASAGVFYFTSGKKVLECVDWGIKNNKYYNGELYLGPCMGAERDLSYFKTLIKFDLGSVSKINLFRKFGESLIQKGGGQ
jgi:hypothetical protein